MATKLKVGDRVKAKFTVDVVPAGTRGKVFEVDPYGGCVSFKGFTGGHNGQGYATPFYGPDSGWYVGASDVIKVRAAKKKATTKKAKGKPARRGVKKAIR